MILFKTLLSIFRNIGSPFFCIQLSSSFRSTTMTGAGITPSSIGLRAPIPSGKNRNVGVSNPGFLGHTNGSLGFNSSQNLASAKYINHHVHRDIFAHVHPGLTSPYRYSAQYLEHFYNPCSLRSFKDDYMGVSKNRGTPNHPF